MSPYTGGFSSRSRSKWRVELQPQFYTQKDTCDGVDDIGKLAGLASAPHRSALRKIFREFFQWDGQSLTCPLTVPGSNQSAAAMGATVSFASCLSDQPSAICPMLLIRSVPLLSPCTYQSFIFCWEVRVTLARMGRGSRWWPYLLTASGTEAPGSRTVRGWTNWSQKKVWLRKMSSWLPMIIISRHAGLIMRPLPHLRTPALLLQSQGLGPFRRWLLICEGTSQSAKGFPMHCLIWTPSHQILEWVTQGT